MRHLILSIILTTSLCCIGNAKAVFSSKKTTNHTIIKNPCTTESAKKQISLRKSYILNNDTLSQILTIRYIVNNRIYYKIKVFNKINHLADSINGMAKANIKADPEIDESSDGTAYPAIQFNDLRKDYVAIRIELGRKNKVQIQANDAKLAKYPSKCPFSSQGILYLKHNNKTR